MHTISYGINRGLNSYFTIFIRKIYFTLNTDIEVFLKFPDPKSYINSTVNGLDFYCKTFFIDFKVFNTVIILI